MNVMYTVKYTITQHFGCKVQYIHTYIRTSKVHTVVSRRNEDTLPSSLRLPRYHAPAVHNLQSRKLEPPRSYEGSDLPASRRSRYSPIYTHIAITKYVLTKALLLPLLLAIPMYVAFKKE